MKPDDTRQGFSGPELDAARIAMLFRMGRAAYLASPAYAAILMVLLWRGNWVHALIAWFAALILVTLVRIVLHGAYLRARGEPALLWERRFALGSFAAGIVWSAPVVLFFAHEDLLAQMALLLVVGGSIIGAAGLYASSPLSLYAYIAPPLVAMVVQLLSQTGPTYRIFAAAVLLFAVIVVRAYRDMSRGVLDALLARLDKEHLLTKVEASEALLRDAIESAPLGMAAFDADDRMLACNEAFAGIYGAGDDRQSLIGSSYRDILQAALDVEELGPVPPEERRAWVEQRLAARWQNGGEAREIRLRDGRWLQGQVVRTSLGGSTSTFLDVTELKSAQDAYLKLLAEENVVLDTLPLGVAFVEGDRIVRSNRRLEQMLGYAAGELGGLRADVWSTSSADDGAGWPALRRALTAGVGADVELELRRGDGSTFWCRVLARPIDARRPGGEAILAFSDIDVKRRADSAVRESEALYRNLVETSNDLIWSIDLERRWTYLNADAVRRIYDCEPDDLLGREFIEFVAPAVQARDMSVFRRVLEGHPVFHYETRHLRRDGSTVDLAFNAIALRDAAGAIIGATGTARDVSEQRRATSALYDTVEKLRLAVEVAALYYWEWDAETDEIRIGQSPGTLGNGDAQAAINWADYAQRVHSDDCERYVAARTAALERGEPYVCEFRLRSRSGVVRWFSARGRPVFDTAGKVRRLIGVSQDISDRLRSEDEARFLAHHDALTGLPNRRLLDDRLRQAVFQAQRRDGRLAVMLVDLDGFRQVNDTLGHRAGDTVLQEAARRLRSAVRKADSVARQGGDEFAVMLPDLQHESDCQVVSEKILRALSESFRVDEHSFQIGASIGISILPDDAVDGETLLRNADVALVRAKQLGRNNYRFFGR